VGQHQEDGELGLLGIPWPESLGGAGFDLLSYLIVLHEMGKVDASHCITISAHTTLGTSPIVNSAPKHNASDTSPC
jgi:butyryl-CoA dehydrogenase